jgi:hypothetical protein
MFGFGNSTEWSLLGSLFITGEASAYRVGLTVSVLIHSAVCCLLSTVSLCRQLHGCLNPITLCVCKSLHPLRIRKDVGASQAVPALP